MLKRGTCLRERWQFQCDASVISAATTPNCSLIAAATVGRSLYLLSSDGVEVWKKTGLDHEGWSTAIAADGGTVAIGTANKNPADGTVYVYNSRGDQVFAYTVKSPVWSVALSHDGSVLAISCWNGSAYRFKRQRDGYQAAGVYSANTTGGLYGIRLNKDGSKGYVCAYNSGIIFLDDKWKETCRSPSDAGLYNIALAEDAGRVVAGLRDGSLLWADAETNDAHQTKIAGCGRPICGVSTSRRGDLAICGSFDGWVYVVSSDGSVLGRLETGGEVWSVASSDDAALICAASGDHTIRLIENACSVAATREITYFESCVKRDGAEVNAALDRLVHAYAQYGVFQYGYSRLREIEQNAKDLNAFQKATQKLLVAATAATEASPWAHYELGLAAQREKRHHDAIKHFQKASTHSDYASRAMANCADSFSAKQLPNATASCYRRAREQQIDSDTKRVLYNLARSYEDTKQWKEAISHYQLLASWDINYRTTWERLEHLTSIQGIAQQETPPPRADYTGLTASLLGPDAPRDVDSRLKDVHQARTAEVLIKPAERERVASIIETLRGNARFSRGITGGGLEYAQETFLKYDFSLPEDETKKFLETVNLLYLLDGYKPSSTLDIGSASGRYPMLFTWFGAKATGIDIEARAVEYAEKQISKDAKERPTYVVGDARKLPFKKSTFGLATCMMGTFAHIPKEDQATVIRKIYDVLKPSGCVAISTWDMECKHLAYLSIYNEKQKDIIRANSPSGSSMKKLLTEAGFVDVEIRPFCLLPQIAVYDLGIENLRSGDIQLAAQADLAVRALYPEKRGEMFLAFGRKPKVK